MKKYILSGFLGKKVRGLYIGDTTVDIVVLKVTLKGPRLLKFGQASIYPKDTSAEEIIPGGKSGPERVKKSKQDYILDAIKRLLNEQNIKPGNIIAAISSEEVMVRYFQMPKIPKQEWKQAVNFEAKRYIPFRMEDVASDFNVIPSKRVSNSLDVVFVAVKQNIIEKYVKLIEAAELTPLIVEPACFSLIRALYAAEQISDKVNTAIVDIERQSATINILRYGVPYIIRNIPLKEGHIGQISLDPIFEKLLSEIKLSFDFYEKQFPNEVIDKMIIYSQLPLENWHEIVGKDLQIPVEVGDPFRGIKIKKDVVPPKLAVAFGVALRQISVPYLDINLYKKKMLVYKRKELFIKALFLEASAAILLLIILKILCMRAIAPLTDELDRTLAERPKIEVNIKDNNIKGLEKLKNKMEKRKNLMEKIISNRTFFTPRLIGLVAVTPENIWLTEVSFEERCDRKDVEKVSRQLDIKGYCLIEYKVTEADSINNYLIDLKRTSGLVDGMSRANIVAVEKKEMDGEKVASFEIKFTGP